MQATKWAGKILKQGNIRRHYVVMSSSAYNEATHMFIGLPITTANYSNNPRYMNDTGVKDYIVLWQLQNFDFNARNGVIVNRVSNKTLKELQRYVNDMVGEYRLLEMQCQNESVTK